MNPVRSMLILCALFCAPVCDAVHVDPDGRGQVLIFPYYTVNAGKATLISVSNLSDSTKAVRVRFRESRNGVEVMAFNLYLAPFDIWTGTVISVQPTGADYAQAAPARLSSLDDSCTVPRLTQPGQDFYTFLYAPPIGSADAGPHQLSRTREGFVEVFELGRVENTENFAAADAIQGGARSEAGSCDLLSEAWLPPGTGAPASARGVWWNRPGTGLLSPDGGLQGSAIIINPSVGSSFSVPAVALDGFFVPAADCAPDCRGRPEEQLQAASHAGVPTLASARSGAAGLAHAEFHHRAQRYRMSFSGPDAGLKAVSAVLMRAHIDNSFTASTSPSLQARADWVLTFPTKGLHLAQPTPEGRLPFRSAYRWFANDGRWPFTEPSGACEHLSFDYRNRTGQGPKLVNSPVFSPPQRVPPRPSLCYASQVVSIGGAEVRQSAGERLHDALRGDAPSQLFGSAHPLRLSACRRSERTPRTDTFRCSHGAIDDDFDSGRFRLHLGQPARNYLYSTLRPDPAHPGEANLLIGLPVIGFAAAEFEGSGTPGVLANFSTLEPHAGERSPVAGRVDPTHPGGGWTPVESP